MQIDRLFEIVYILLNKGNTTASALAEHFGVTKRTILRDINVLTVAGVPVCTSQGKGGGIYLPSEFVLDKAVLSAEEREQILLGLKTIAPTGRVAPNGILSKLGSMFAGANADWIEVDFSRWGNSDIDSLRFETVKKSIISKTALSFTYYSTEGGRSERSVYPLKIIYKGQAWYLQAYCTDKRDYRIFKLNRMHNVRALPQPFEASEFSAPDIRTDSKSHIPEIEFEAVFAPSSAYRIYEEFAPENIVLNSDNTLTVKGRLPAESWLYGYFLSFGNSLIDIQPEDIKIKLQKKIAELQKNLNK